MPSPLLDSIRHLCHRRLESFIRREPHLKLPCPFDQALSEITRIVSENVPERFEHYARYRSDKHRLTRPQYVDRVIAHWRVESPRVHRLHAKDDKEWTRLCDDLAQVAAHRLAQSGHIHSVAASAEDFAERACIRILESRYPFDVAFDAWARTILRNLIFEPARSSDVLDQPHLSLDGSGPSQDHDTSNSILETLPDVKSDSLLNAIEDRSTLIELVKQLSPLQQSVIVMQYFDGLDDTQIARRLGKTQSNVHTLRHRALRRLSQLAPLHGVKEKRLRTHQESKRPSRKEQRDGKKKSSREK